MKSGILRSVLGLGLLFLLSGIIFSSVSGCKKDESTKTKLVVTTLDSAGVTPLAGSIVTVRIDSNYKAQSKPVDGLPQTSSTDASGVVTFEFKNGLILLIDAENGDVSEQSFAAMSPGETANVTMRLKKVPH